MCSPRTREMAREQDWVCPLCGGDLRDGRQVNVDHIIPKSLGGSNHRDNRQAVHLVCNLKKGAEMPRLPRPTPNWTHMSQAEIDLDRLRSLFVKQPG